MKPKRINPGKPLPKPIMEQAAQEIAEGRYGFGQIAERAGIEVRTLYIWRKQKEFSQRVERLSAQMAEAARALAIRRKEYRVGVLNNLQSRLLAVIEERAADPSMANIPGGKTGLLVRQYKVSGDTVREEYAADTALIRELRAVAEDAAKELGQKVEKHDHRIRSLKDLTDEELAAFASELGEEEA